MLASNCLHVNLLDTEASRGFVALSSEERQMALRLGVSFIRYGVDVLQGWSDEEWSAKVAGLEETIKDGARASAARMEATIEEVRSLERLKWRSECEQLECSNKRLTQRADDLNALCMTAHSKIEQTCADRVRETAERYEARLTTLQDRCDSLSVLRHNSTLKGQRGEEYVLAELNRLLPKAEVEDTHRTPGRGDFIVRDGDLVVMVETKSYQQNVKKCELDKFYRDLDDPGNEDVQCALFLSLDSGIAQRADFSFEARSPRSIPILFLHNVRENFQSVQLGMAFFRLVLRTEGVDLGARAVVDGFRSLATALKRNFTKQKARLNKFHQEQLAITAEQEVRTAELYTMAGLTY
jgi:hypothetical protein